MVIKYVVCDWNGTLFEPPTDEGLNKAIAYKKLSTSVWDTIFGRIWKVADIISLLRSRKDIKKRLADYKSGRCPITEVYQPFNEHVVRGMPESDVVVAMYSYVEKLLKAANLEVGLVDRRITWPLRQLEHKHRRGILSTSQKRSIRYALTLDHNPDLFLSEDMVANTIDRSDGIANGLTLDIYGHKGEVFEDEFLRKRGYIAGETVYAGDTEDDLPVAELLPRGHFVVPFYATDAFRNMAASRYGAFVPKDQDEWAEFLDRK